VIKEKRARINGRKKGPIIRNIHHKEPQVM
jgi:hypothetical protein